MNLPIFKKSQVLEKEVDDFLDQLSQSTLLFRKALQNYLLDQDTLFFEKIKEITEKEGHADNLRRDVENKLYLYTLVPESRADILIILENLDKIYGRLKGVLWMFYNEQPFFPKEFHHNLIELTENVMTSLESLIISVRSFFKNVIQINNDIHKVMFYESNADKINSQLIKEIYSKNNLSLAEKMHLRTIIKEIDAIADAAEDLAETLVIYTIKRSI